MEVLLRNIVTTQSELVILDVTGVTAMDSQVASYVMQTVRSASLLGARCVLTGIQPEVAQAVVGLGLDMEKVVIKKDMRDGLKWALQAMGYQVRNGHTVRG
jgi:rsbT co-antagonist protein RsbR